jgi:hypothetical protein
MSRLIDADEFIKKFSYAKANTKEENIMCATVRRMVKEQPTAFDVEKVLDELKHEESEALRRYSESKGTAYAFSDKCSCDSLTKAIEIVKRGGRDEI